MDSNPMKMKTIHQMTALLALVSALAPACTEVIELDLNTTAPRLVIEGYVNDQPGPYYVKVSETLNFDAANNWPAVSGATVLINDNEGVLDTLLEVEPGLYATTHLQGFPGNTYTLIVEVDGKKHIAVSTMPRPVALDTAYLTKSAVMGGENVIPVLEFTDPAGEANYYNLVVKKNGWSLPGFFTLEDQIRDGQYISRPLRSADFEIEPGDRLLAELQAVDPAVYTYFYVLGQAAGLGLNQSPTPSNPTGNFGGDVLGYFSAHTSSVFEIKN